MAGRVLATGNRSLLALPAATGCIRPQLRGDRLRPRPSPRGCVRRGKHNACCMLEELKNAARKAGAERALRGALADCRRLLSERGAANSVAIASSLVTRFSALPDEQQARFFERLSRDFSPDPKAVLQSAQAYADDPSAPNLLRLTQVSRATAARAAAAHQPCARRHVEHRRDAPRAARSASAGSPNCWHSRPTCCTCCRAGSTPASCELRNASTGTRRRNCSSRSSTTRRCTRSTAGTTCAAACSPTGAASRSSIRSCPNEPLIFVEVALLPEMPERIAPLIDKASPPLPAEPVQGGRVLLDQQLPARPAGVSLGNFLIKRVAEELKRELPQLQDLLHAVADPGLRALAARRSAVRRPGKAARRASGAGARAVARSLRRGPRPPGERRGAAGPGRRREAGVAAARCVLPLRALGRHRRRPGGALPPRQRCAARAAERPGRPVGQGPVANRSA